MRYKLAQPFVVFYSYPIDGSGAPMAKRLLDTDFTVALARRGSLDVWPESLADDALEEGCWEIGRRAACRRRCRRSAQAGLNARRRTKFRGIGTGHHFRIEGIVAQRCPLEVFGLNVLSALQVV